MKISLLLLACAALANGSLLLHYKLDGNGVDSASGQDVSGGAQPAADRAGNAAGAMHFSRNAGHTLATTFPAGFGSCATAEGLTFSAWFKLDDWQGSGATFGIISIKGVGGDSSTYRLQIISQRLYFNLGEVTTRSSGYVPENAVKVNFGEWHHYAVTLDPATGEAKAYYDFQHVYSRQGVPATLLNFENGRIGAADTNGLYNWYGELDDVRVYCGVLTAADLQAPPTCQNVAVGGAAVAAEPVAAPAMVGGSGLELRQVPAFLQGASDAFFPPLPVAGGSTLDVDCCGGTCTFFVAVYHCSPCSAGRNGGLVQELTAQGWAGSSCAPKFAIGEKGYPMTVLYKEVDAPQSFQTLAGVPADHLAVFKVAGAVPSPLCPVFKGPAPATGCQTDCAP